MSKKTIKQLKNLGPISLQPTPEGRKMLFSFTEPVVDKLFDRYTERTKYIETGNWVEAELSTYEIELTEEFVDTYVNAPPSIKIPKKYHVLAAIILNYAKSWYEYQDEGNPITDELYDCLIAKYKSQGKTETTGVVPNTATSTEIKNPELHNNLDKCYRIYEHEEIPEGTAEKTSVESWLQKCYDGLELPKSHKIKLMLANKLDGVSVIADIDHDGRIKSAQSRGDSNKAMSMPGLIGIPVVNPSFMHNFKPFSIQYEMFCTHRQRDLAPKIIGLDREYKSNRSAIAAIRKRAETANIPDIEYVISLYPILGENITDESGVMENYEEIIDFIQNFARVPKDMCEPEFITGDFDSLLESIKEYFKRLEEQRDSLSYPIDGVVITVADKEYQQVLGRDGRTNKFQIAMKFNPAFADVKVHSIYLSSGNKGYRTIMVRLDHPVFIDGAEYTEVQVLSARQFDELELEKGAMVRVHRTGDVIPKLTKIKKGRGNLIKLPDECPTCFGPLIRDAQKLKCENPHCPDNMAGRIKSFFDTLDIEGYSDAFAKTLVNIGVSTPEKLIKLTPEYLKRNGVSGKREDEFVSIVQEKVKAAKDYVLIAAFGLPGIGKITAKKILMEIPLQTLVTMNTYDMANSIKAIRGFNESALTLACTFETYIDELKFINEIVSDKNRTSNNIPTVTIGHTGISPSVLVKYWVDMVGYDITDGQSFDILLVADKNSKSRKMMRAIQKGIKVYTEDELVRYLKGRYFYKMSDYVKTLPDNITSDFT